MDKLTSGIIDKLSIIRTEGSCHKQMSVRISVHSQGIPMPPELGKISPFDIRGSIRSVFKVSIPLPGRNITDMLL